MMPRRREPAFQLVEDYVVLNCDPLRMMRIEAKRDGTPREQVREFPIVEVVARVGQVGIRSLRMDFQLHLGLVQQGAVAVHR